MIYYIADMHFGHTNVLRFDNRPFSDTAQMDDTLIQNWNERVASDDSVYVLGDAFWKNEENSVRIMEKLNGHKHLIQGNHDRVKGKLRLYWQSIEPYAEVNDENRLVILSHYPILFYKNQHYGAVMLRNGRKSSRQIISRPFRSARTAEKTFSRNGDPAHSAVSAATPVGRSGGQTTGKQIRLWRKSPCGANAADRRCAWIRKSIAAVPVISVPWRKRTASRYARGAEKNFRSMREKIVSIAAGTARMPQRLRRRAFKKVAAGFGTQNRKAGQRISSKPRGKRG